MVVQVRKWSSSRNWPSSKRNQPLNRKIDPPDEKSRLRSTKEGSHTTKMLNRMVHTTKKCHLYGLYNLILERGLVG
jgi:hypothetical protein